MLSLFAAIITKLRELMAPEVPRVFEAIFECTLQMITKNFAVSDGPTQRNPSSEDAARARLAVPPSASCFIPHMKYPKY